MNQPNIDAVAACSVCYGTGFQVDGKPCPFPHRATTDRAATVAKDGGDALTEDERSMVNEAIRSLEHGFMPNAAAILRRIIATPKPEASAATQQAWGRNMLMGVDTAAPISEDTFEEMRQNYLDLLSDVLEAKEVMVAAGIERASFPEMFAKFAAPSVQGVPEGWKLVPVEPTQAMNTAGYMRNLELGSAKRSADETYKAMIAAAPNNMKT